jgi:hypothetical protein
MLMYEIQLKEYYERARTEKVEMTKLHNGKREQLESDEAIDDMGGDEEGEEGDRRRREEIHNLKQEVERLRLEIGNICTCHWKVTGRRDSQSVASNIT